jgi:uncharacterized protein (TIGR03086 family)
MSTQGLERAYARTRSILVNVAPDQLSAPTPCQSWQVRDVVNHLIGVSFFYAETLNTGAAPPPVEADFTSGDLMTTFDEAADRALTAFAAPGAEQKTVTLRLGPLPGRAFMGIAAIDVLVHGWDLARATGQPTDFEPELAEQLLDGARALLQPSLRGDDGKAPFGEEQPAPPDATPTDRLAAFLGRRV